MGIFWVLTRSDRSTTLNVTDSLPGHARLLTDGIEVRVMVPAGQQDLEQAMREFDRSESLEELWLVGQTEAGMFVLPEVRRSRRQIQLGGSKPSVRTYRGPAAITGANPASLSTKITKLTVEFPNPAWAGLNPVNEKLTVQQATSRRSIDVALRPTDSIDAGKVGSLRLRLTGTWYRSADSRRSSVEITSALKLSVDGRAGSVRDYIDIATRVQDLVSLAYDAFLPATAATVHTPGESASDGLRLWHHSLLDAAQKDPPPAASDAPYFRLKDLDPRSIARWVTLTRQYPDVSHAISVRDRARRGTAARTLQLGAAIELYVTQCRTEGRSRGSTPKWTSKRSKHDTFASALARHAGPAFAEFVGDVDDWGRAFTDTYNGAKHPTSRAASGILNVAAELLLIVTMLNRAGMSRRCSSAFLRHHQIREIGGHVRDLLETVD
ncbi:hypothetical protein CLV29_2770 [Naumannella halotolerans]|uniref:ApeA N-terminal domain-containing protein n=2 Tax=Naumannella halotolerans TaxID=993414 RepID=A0A4R7J2C8_9ACTN|nr:hypothetical protein CLV29_2770 [Naumannella halotolerans]